MRDEIVDLSVDPDQTGSERVKEIGTLPSVAHVAALNDLHSGLQEAPVSIVTATTDRIYLELTSNVINCGMCLLTTDLTEDQVTDEFLSNVCAEIDTQAEALAPDRSDVTSFLSHGAEYVVDKLDLDPDIREHIENYGSMFEPDSYPKDINDIVPPWLLRHSGTYQDTPVPSLSSNHFIEFQVIEEIADSEIAAEWGLSEDQVVIFMHGDYALTFYLNWHHANRRKFREQMGVIDRMKMQASKAAFHLYRDGLRAFPNNWQRYNSTDRFTGIDAQTDQGLHLARVIYAAMNFGYANRLLASICLDRAITEVTDGTAGADLLWDVGHDTIQKETIDDEMYWIHRKGAAKAVPDKPALISGSYNMNSFLGKCLPGTTATLNSYDHGCSNVIDYFDSEDQLTTLDRQTRMYEYPEGKFTEEVRHIPDAPLRHLVKKLATNNVLSEVAWLRPVANVSE
jgi:tRNA-splicing ligase RtcB